MNENSQPPLTWLDVARRLASVEVSELELPASIVSARVGWFGLLLEATGPVEVSDLAASLQRLFPGRVRTDPIRIELEGGEGQTALAVEVEFVSQPSHARQPFGVVDGVIDFRTTPTRSVKRPVPIVAALSVKGGTGRTTSAVALALRWAERAAKPILLVDADLEAPGISYMFQSYFGSPKVSLEDLVVLAHSEDEPSAPAAISFVAERMRDHLLPGNVYVLPLRRDIDELASSSVRPEHLSTPERPFALGDLLSEVACRLGCAGVVVDVRAGLVPLGVNMAMDPDVSPVLVTTLAEQSVRGTQSFIRFLGREFRRAGIGFRRPLLIVNRVPNILRHAGVDDTLIAPITSEIVRYAVPDVVDEVGSSEDVYEKFPELTPFYQATVPELADIQVPSGRWREYTAQLTESGFSRALNTAADEFIATELGLGTPVTQTISLAKPKPTGRKALARFAKNLIAAENVQGRVPRPLVTQPLAELSARFVSETPIVVVEGAKGTGKTLAARYMASKGRWRDVVSDFTGQDVGIDALLLPACASVQVSGSYQQEADNIRLLISEELGLASPMSVAASTDFLKSQIAANLTEVEWVDTWLDVVAWSSGCSVAIKGAGIHFINRLRASGRHIVPIFEGLEELYTSATAPGVQSAMRALLISLPQRLRSETRRPIGMLALVRRDTVEASIHQNLDQFRREYENFALSWTEDDVLELAAWLATESGALPGLWDSDFAGLSTSDKSARLEPLWGRKLGPDDIPGSRTREAYAATWIIAVLSDLRGRLVPRDLVRLLANAAGTEPMGDEIETFASRLLIPRALRDAVEPTSVKKVSETLEEIVELASAFAKFQAKSEELSVPLTADVVEALDLSDPELEALKRHGIVFGEKPPFEVPELFRRGLGLRHSGARRSVVNMYRRARGSSR